VEERLMAFAETKMGQAMEAAANSGSMQQIKQLIMPLVLYTMVNGKGGWGHLLLGWLVG
jgi:hypothetical protein